MSQNFISGLVGPAAALDVDFLPSRASRALFWRAKYLASSTWLEHLPFAFWLIETCRPRALVELGLGEGVSYFAFCQAVDKLNTDTRCTGIDHWRGDGVTTLEPGAADRVAQHNAALYEDFSCLLTDDLEASAVAFADASIDLLHVDVEITASTIESLLTHWAGKLTRRGVVLMHGVRTRFTDRAATAFLRDLRARYPSIEFSRGEGLVVLLVGPEQPDKLRRLAGLAPGDPGHAPTMEVFERLGRGHLFEWQARSKAARAAELADRLAAAKAALAEQGADLDIHRAALAARGAQAASAEAGRFDAETALAAVQTAASEAEEMRVAAETARAAAVAEISRLNDGLAEREHALTSLRAEAAALSLQLEDRFRETATLTGMLEAAAEAEEMRVAAETARAAAVAEISRLNDGLAEREHALTSLRAETEQIRVAAETARAAAVAEISRLNDGLAELQAAQIAALTEFAGLRDYARTVERLHLGMLESRTWRAMEPLRGLSRLVTRRKPPKLFVPRLDTHKNPMT